MRNTHSDRLERWLGPAVVQQLSACNHGFYGSKPIPIAGVPAGIGVRGDGDFVGHLDMGSEACLEQYLEDQKRKRWRHAKATKQFGGWATDVALQKSQRQQLFFQKSVTSSVTAVWSSFRAGTNPVAGAAAAAAPGGTVPTSASVGALPFVNSNGNEYRFLRADTTQSVTNTQGVSLMYDRIFAVAKTMNSTATEAVTGVPTRYQSTTQGAENSAENNFLFMECGTVLPATAHNWTVCTYTDQSGNAGATLPSVTGNASNQLNRLDMPLVNWWCPLASGDTGIQALTQMQCSALVATGAIDFVIGHPIAWLPSTLGNMPVYDERILTAPCFARLYDNACLSFLTTQASAGNTVLAGYVEFGN